MNCPTCGKPLRCPACDGRRGGSAKVKKGFSDRAVQARAQATLEAKRTGKIIVDSKHVQE